MFENKNKIAHLKLCGEPNGENTAKRKCSRTWTCIWCVYRLIVGRGLLKYVRKLLKKCDIMLCSRSAQCVTWCVSKPRNCWNDDNNFVSRRSDTITDLQQEYSLKQYYLCNYTKFELKLWIKTNNIESVPVALMLWGLVSNIVSLYVDLNEFKSR